MPTTLAPVDLCNIALSKIGAQSINSLIDGTNASSLQCNKNFQLAYLEVSRSSRWNCLLTTAVLTQIPQIPIPNGNSAPPTYTAWAANTFYMAGVYVSYQGGFYQVQNNYTSSSSFTTDLANGYLLPYNSNGANVINAVPWAQFTFYQANSFVTYGNYYYQVMYNYTSSNNFNNDLTIGALTQTDENTWSPNFWSAYGAQYASGWPFQYALPSDFQLLAVLNSNSCWDFDGAGGDDYEIMGTSLFANCRQAVIQYVQNQPDTTRFDSLFSDAFTFKLASSISTALRQDGGRMEAEMLQAYEKQLAKARAKNGGEQQARRWNPIRSSRFNQARYGGING